MERAAVEVASPTSRALTPTQQRLLDQLRRDATPLVFDEAFVTDLVTRAREAVDELAERLGGEKLYVSKSFLTRALGCEVQHLQPSEFEWNPSTARGFVAHKAIELHLNWRGEPNPSDLIDEALARLAEEPSRRGDWIAGLTDADHAQLRCFALERLTRFVQDFPPLPRSADPIPEASSRWRPNACVELAGKADLVLGRLDGRTSRRLIVDFKTGGRSHHHRHDLRFYALLETLCREVPPRKLVTYYLDYAEAEVEDVTEGILESALERVLGALERHVELTVDRRPPVKRAGASCRWCPVLPDCDDGRTHLALVDDDGSQGFD